MMGETLNQMPPGWMRTTLGEVLEFKYGKSLPAKKRNDYGYPVYGSNGEVGRHSVPLTQGPTLIVGRKGSIGEIHLSNEKCWPIDTTYFIDEFYEQPPEFWLHRLRTLRLADLDRATALPGLNRNDAYKLAIDLPPVNEQKRIVARIEELQAHSNRTREALESIPDLLEQLRKSILGAAFRGDLTKKWREQHPDVEPASELLKRIRVERRKRWEASELEKLKGKGLTSDKLDEAFGKQRKKYKDPIQVDTSDLPELPEGWRWAYWDEVGFCQNGRAFPSKYYSEEGVRLLRPGNLHVSGRIEWTPENTRRLPETWAERYKEYIITEGELVINLTAQSLKDEFLGRVCLTGPSERCLLNQRLARLTPVELPPEFCLWLFKSPVFRRYVDTLNTGSLIQHMFTTQIKNFILPLPPKQEQEMLVQMVEELLRVREKFDESLSSLDDLLDNFNQSILSKAFRGQLVPQDPNDEPASVLLERIRKEKERDATIKKPKDRRIGKKMKKKKDKQKELLVVLREESRAMTPEEVFLSCGFEEDSVDAFYEQLRKAVDSKQVREMREGDLIQLEVIEE
jgi:type I restriction enzyme S subunit